MEHKVRAVLMLLLLSFVTFAPVIEAAVIQGTETINNRALSAEEMNNSIGGFGSPDPSYYGYVHYNWQGNSYIAGRNQADPFWNAEFNYCKVTVIKTVEFDDNGYYRMEQARGSGSASTNMIQASFRIITADPGPLGISTPKWVDYWGGEVIADGDDGWINKDLWCDPQYIGPYWEASEQVAE